MTMEQYLRGRNCLYIEELIRFWVQQRLGIQKILNPFVKLICPVNLVEWVDGKKPSSTLISCTKGFQK